MKSCLDDAYSQVLVGGSGAGFAYDAGPLGSGGILHRTKLQGTGVEGTWS